MRAAKDIEQSRQNYFRARHIERIAAKVSTIFLVVGIIAFIVSVIGLVGSSCAVEWLICGCISIMVTFIGFTLIPIVGLILMVFEKD